MGLAFVFPGQGAQCVGMGQCLAEHSKAARETLTQADDALGFGLSALMQDGPPEKLAQTEIAQPAILTVAIAAWRAFKEQTEFQPIVAAGHSLGEYAALVCAGALTFGEAVRAVRERGKLMQEAVIKHGQVVYQQNYGMADLERHVPITPVTVFDIGSTSKQFTAMCILLLAKQGKLSLDDEIQKYVPELPRYPDRITIRHLIHHTSGIRDYLVLMSLAGMSEVNDYSEQQVLDLLARQKGLNFKPGEEYLYSNSGYFLLSVIVKRASGKSLRTFAEENIFRPLKMEHTHFHDDFTEIVKHRALAYGPKDGGGHVLNISLFDVVGDGCLFTTVGDLAKWDENFYNNKLGGGKQLVEKMETPGKLNNGSSLKYAFGLVIDDYRGLRTVSHGGAWAGYRAELLRFPSERFSVIVLANRSDTNPTALARQVADIYLANRLAPAEEKDKPKTKIRTVPKTPVQVPLPLLETYVGEYEFLRGVVLNVFIKNGCLFAQATGQDQFELLAATDNTFYPKDFEAQFVFEKMPDGKPVKKMMLHQGGHDIPGKRITPYVPKPNTLKMLCGEYASEELGVTYSISLKDGSPVLTNRANMEDQPLRPITQDELRAPGRILVFERNNQKQVTGFRLDAGRVKNVNFLRVK